MIQGSLESRKIVCEVLDGIFEYPQRIKFHFTVYIEKWQGNGYRNIKK